MEDTDTDDMSPDPMCDDISGQQVDGTLVREARMNELEGFGNMGVWDTVDKGDCHQKNGKPPIRGRWVNINKGDDKKPSVSIQVCCSRVTASARRHYPRRTLCGNATFGGYEGGNMGRGHTPCPWERPTKVLYLLTSPWRICTRQ